MKFYEVAAGVATFGPGQKLTLTPEQIAPRRHNLDVPGGYDGKKQAEVTALSVLQFKVGEKIGLPTLERRLVDVMVPLSQPEGENDKMALTKDGERKKAAAEDKKKADSAAKKPAA